MKIWLMALVVALIGLGVSSCSKDDDANGLSGVYGCDYMDGYGACYYFTSSNTVIFYSSAHLGETSGGNGMLAAHERIGNSRWYCCEGERGLTYTYVAEGNKVIIPMKGTILTVSGKTITEDGGLTYKK